jgi:O-antigen/teichoic acid export membrane protein
MSTTSRVVKNTGFLYVKMGVTIFVSLYTLRILLASLGAADYGIFTIVGGAIAMLGFLNSTMANATQRFMSYAEGEGDLEKKKKIFNVSIILHVLIALLTCVLLLLVFYPLFNGILNIQADRVYAAKVVYFSLIFSTLLTIVNAPYDAVMNAHENMLYYSIIGIFESLLKLLIAFYCVYTSDDKLIVYGLLMAMVPVITLTIMKVYCHKHYEECVIAPRRYWDYVLIRRIATFSGWNFLTAVSSLLTFQGLGVVLNHFYGTVLNAAHGIALQVNSQLSQFSVNMMKALNPVIVKSAGAGNYEMMNRVTIAGCKFSTYIMLFFAIPLIVEMPYVLKIWLVDVPEWTILFCILQIVVGIICQMANSAATAVYAQGNIKWYAIYKSIMNILPVILTYVSFALGGAPYWLYVPMVIIWGIGGDLVIVRYAQKQCGLPVMEFVKGVLTPVVGVSVVMLLMGALMTCLIEESFFRLLSSCVMTTIGLLISLLLFGMSRDERMRAMEMVKR